MHIRVECCMNNYFCRQVPGPPPEIVDWAQNTVLGAFAGLLYCGYREWQNLQKLGNCHLHIYFLPASFTRYDVHISVGNVAHTEALLNQVLAPAFVLVRLRSILLQNNNY